LLIIIPHIIISIFETVALQRKWSKQFLQRQKLSDTQKSERLVEIILNKIKSEPNTENLQRKNEELDKKLNEINRVLKIVYQKKISNRRSKQITRLEQKFQ
jgi:hypothetical protein